MKLRRLSLAGFKTFADKTDIELSDGVTAVVGPNGCGKSNIADALLWVLGEQNPRLLRGSETRDFIFSGSDRRKPLGMAEVRLTVDNADGGLAVEFAEIEVSRRVYRSGESRYAINGVQCRLKDVVDLFLDTGMGRGAYSFISQSEVDAVLSAKPEDRRELFEEAAGVQRYRARKREALRKLEQAEANLTRIADIVHELEKQREPLRAQAGLAERYIAMTERLRSVEVSVLISEIQRADYELYAARRDRELDIAAVREFDDRLAAMERRAVAVRESLAEAESELETAGLSRQGAMTSVERTAHQLQLTAERARSAEASAATLEADIRELTSREQAAESAAARDRSGAEKAGASELNRKAALAAAHTRLEAALAVVAEIERAGRDRAQEQRRLLAERAAREAALAACAARLDAVAARLEELVGETAQQAGVVAETEQAVGSARVAVSRLEVEVETASEAAAGSGQVVRAAEAAQAAALAEADAMRRRSVELGARLAALREVHESGEGLFQGVRAVLQAARSGAIAGEFRTVVDALTVPEPFRTAVEVALGSDAQSLICATDTMARDAVAWLKANKQGRATFLALTLLDPPPALGRRDLDGLHGVIGVASEIVQCEPELVPAIRLLLGRVIVFQDVDAAIAASRRLRGWRRLVTLEGETLSPGGAITGGSLPSKAAHLVSRKGEMDDLHRDLALLDADLARCDGAADAARAALDAARASAAAADEESRLRSSALLEARRDLASAEREAASAQGRAADLAAEGERTARTRDALAREKDEWEAALVAHGAKGTELDGDIAEAQTVAARAQRACDEARRAALQLEVEVGRLAEQARAARAALERSERSAADARAARAAKQAAREQIARTIAEAEASRVELEAAGVVATERLAGCEEVFARWRDERQTRLEESFALTASIKDTTNQRRITMENLHEEELRIARLEVRMAQHAQRLTDDYAMTLEEALAAPDPGEMDRDTLNEIVRLRRELRAMGTVNTGAAEEFRRLTERYEFLESQREDSEAAAASLRQTIAEIDSGTRAVFMETFDAVSTEFRALFRRLFGGGETRLVLTNPDDLLETGIEIVAQPPGKRASGLALLSGGERALTAVALLFGLLAVKPSPFVVLDEVDAPLDGPNVERFAELVTDFARATQFLIITHNPTTMENAPRWYGVTMQEPGVSRVVSYCPEKHIRTGAGGGGRGT